MVYLFTIIIIVMVTKILALYSLLDIKDNQKGRTEV